LPPSNVNSEIPQTKSNDSGNTGVPEKIVLSFGKTAKARQGAKKIVSVSIAQGIQEIEAEEEKPQDKDDKAKSKRFKSMFDEVSESKAGKSSDLESDAAKPLGSSEPEFDPLDAYMCEISDAIIKDETKSKPVKAPQNEVIFDDEVYSEEDFEMMAEDEFSWLKSKEKRLKKKEIKKVDHSKIAYLPFRKNFYIESPEIASMTLEEVSAYREKELEGVKIRGKNCPKPIMRWTQCGLPAKILDLLQKNNYTAPFPIQAQVIPAIMSGRDLIACAKTGSGKTLAFLLPLFRHVLDQPSLDVGDGPIGLILAPTRELALQITSEAKKFAKHLNLRIACCYGGAGVADQIASLKRGAEIIVATPGRMIDMLCANQGKVTNLRRVTFVCLDEADRMFDMGFEPQISAILMNVRPEHQTVMFSATFPKQIEGLAKRSLTDPLEIIIGGRSIASNTIKQVIEVREENTKFSRLLQLLSEWQDRGLILVFVDRQEAVDHLFSDLMRAGYLCLALHGGMDQSDRDYTILDFKKKMRTIMIATSVAARGLDVKELVLVINYSAPHHYEDYIHRIGRTGRAGSEGTAYTFLTPGDEAIAVELVKAMESSNQEVLPELLEMSNRFKEKRKTGEVRYDAPSGYSTEGFKFDEKEAQKKLDDQKRQKKVYGTEEDNVESEESDAEFDDESFEKAASSNLDSEEQFALAKKVASALRKAANAAASEKVSHINRALDLKQELSKAVTSTTNTALAPVQSTATSSALNPEAEYYAEELEINDYPQEARMKVTRKGSLADVQEWTDVAITSKGVYIPSNRKPGPGERKLYLLIEGKSRISVMNAKKEIRRVLEEASLNAKPDENAYGKYVVV
jgi:ATP-dependent RNA helicase DDX46/PRP5